MSKNSYDFDAAYAAMCMWEEITQPTMDGAPMPWQEMREQIGTAELRERVLNLGAACDAAWSRTYAKHEVDYGIWRQRQQEHEVRGEPFFDEEPQDTGSFDWEFTPFWMRNCVDWTDHHNGPRVKGSGT